MVSYPVELSELARRRALSRGGAGEQWLERLDEIVGDLERRWRSQITAVPARGTEGLALDATRACEEPVVLKLLRAGIAGGDGEVRALRLARGMGYARLREYGEDCNAMCGPAAARGCGRMAVTALRRTGVDGAHIRSAPPSAPEAR
jgi:hypothetical protein